MALIRRNLLGLGDVTTVANEIQTIEGYIAPNSQYPQGSISYRYNNPGNLRPAGQTGCTPVSTASGTFCSFPTYDDGYSALENQIELQASEGQTIQQFVNQYAPPSENNSTSYAAAIASATGLSVNDPLSAAISGGDSSSTSATGDDSTDDSGNTDSSSDADTSSGIDPTVALGIGATLLAFAWLLSR